MAPARSPFDDPPASKRAPPAPLHLRPEPKYVDDEKRQSGVAALGMGLMNMDDSDDDSDEDEKPMGARADHRSPPPPVHQQTRNGPIPLAAPRPGYAAPSSFVLAPPAPIASPATRARVVSPEDVPQAYENDSATPMSAGPPSPLPLGVPVTPIQPVFARPAKTTRDVKFSGGGIMRGQDEDVLIPKRGEKGDDFWRRFSMIAHDQSTKKPNEKTSSWLRKTQDGTSRHSRYVLLVGLFLLMIIAAAIGFGWYISHNSTTTSVPKAIGGSGDHAQLSSEGVAATKAGGVAATVVPHVSPTHTVARRDPFQALNPTLVAVPPAHKRHSQLRRSNVNRSFDMD